MENCEGRDIGRKTGLNFMPLKKYYRYCRVPFCSVIKAGLWDVPADAGFLCGKAAMLRDTIKGTVWRWEINISMFQRKEKLLLYFNWNS
jgi:hypothetical protein